MAGKGRAKAPENETNAERFTRIAKVRMNNILNAIASLNNLAGASYEYTEPMLAAMDKAIADQSAKTFAYLRNPKGGSGVGFDFEAAKTEEKKD
jgi:hypothetical protein